MFHVRPCVGGSTCKSDENIKPPTASEAASVALLSFSGSRARIHLSRLRQASESKLPSASPRLRLTHNALKMRFFEILLVSTLTAIAVAHRHRADNHTEVLPVLKKPCVCPTPSCPIFLNAKSVSRAGPQAVETVTDRFA